MSLSSTVEESVREAESHLRNALAYAARQESPYVPLALSEIIFKLDTLIEHDRFMDKIKSVKENFRGGIDID